MKSNFKYDPILRTNYAAYSAAAWLAGAAVTFLVVCFRAMFFDISTIDQVLFYVAWIDVGMGLFDLFRAMKFHTRRKSLKGRPLSFISISELSNKVKDKAHSQDQWLGYGFVWEPRHTQAAFDILERDYQTEIDNTNASQRMGQGWIHGVEPSDSDIWQPLEHLEGHTLITGNPGTGKTRLIDLLINQRIRHGESVLIVDPKGDANLRKLAQCACKAAGHEDCFLVFHPAFPAESIAINPLKNYNRTTELASRITALLPKGSNSPAFTAFAWQTVNDILTGMLFCNVEPTLTELCRYVTKGVDALLLKAIIKHVEDVDSRENLNSKHKHQLIGELAITEDLARNIGNESIVGTKTVSQLARLAAGFYRLHLEPSHPQLAVDGLIGILEHDSEHYSKMIASLTPVLKMLTADSMKNLLSPQKENSKNQIFDLSDLTNKPQKVVYIGLDALSDPVVGHNVGSLLLADLASVAGERFNFVSPDQMAPINIFIDEACEVLNEPFIQLLNKGRGAGMRLFIATQSISDFAATMGSKDRANQILGNINNKFAFRTLDKASQDYLSEHMPTTMVKHVVHSHGVGKTSKEFFSITSHTDERLDEKESKLFFPQLFSMLPNLEYVAFISGGKTYKGRLPIVTVDTALNQKDAVSNGFSTASSSTDLSLEAPSEGGTPEKQVIQNNNLLTGGKDKCK